ncbi:hypothetical protein [Kribbella sp. NPDC055071]
MSGKRNVLAAAGVLMSLLAVGATASTAQASTAEPDGTRVTQSVEPDGTRVTQVRADGAVEVGVVAGSASSRSIAAIPSTSPAVEHVFITGSQTTTCNVGYACAAVPYGNGTYVFKFVHYDGYSVSYWGGLGYFVNNQTGNAGARYDNQNGSERGCVPAGIIRYNLDWGPVYRIRLTAAAC